MIKRFSALAALMTLGASPTTAQMGGMTRNGR